MKRTKKWFALLMTMILIAAAACGCGGSPSGDAGDGGGEAKDVIEITFPIHTGEGTNEHETLKRYKELVEERTDGRVIINLYPGATLGTELENLEQVKTGECQMSIFGDNLTGQLAPEYDPTCIPFVFKSVDEVYEVWDGEIGDMIKGAVEERGNMYVVALQARGARNLTAAKEITEPSQLKGLKLRVPEIANWITVWKALGTLPTPIAWSETYSALQTGVADGQENPISQIYVSKINEVNPYIIKTEHLFNVFHWTINKDFYDGLDPELQTILMDTAAECVEWGDSQLQASEDKMTEELLAAGAHIVEVDKDQFIQAAKPGVLEVCDGMEPAVADLIRGYIGE